MSSFDVKTLIVANEFHNDVTVQLQNTGLEKVFCCTSYCFLSALYKIIDDVDQYLSNPNNLLGMSEAFKNEKFNQFAQLKRLKYLEV